MLARDHRSARESNLDFVLLEYEQGLLQLKQLSYLYLVHLEQQSAIHDEQQPPAVLHPKQQGQPEVPVVQG